MKPSADPYRQLKRITANIASAEDAMNRELARVFPKDVVVEFYRSHGQQRPSIGTVIGHNGGRYGYVVIRMRSGHVCRISYDEIRRSSVR